MKKLIISLLSMLLAAGMMTGCDWFTPIDSSSTGSDSQSESTGTSSDDSSNDSSDDSSNDSSDDSSDDSSGDEKEYCTITFKQDGQPDIVKTVEKDGAFNEEWPTPVEKTGYTFEWVLTCTDHEHDYDWGHITTDHVFTAEATPKTYTVSYDCGMGTLPEDVSSSQEVTYDSIVTHPTPVLDGWQFVAWTYNGETISEKWNIDANDTITLVATWADVRPVYTIKFVQDGQPDVEIQVKKGESLTEIPEPVQTPGYVTTWANCSGPIYSVTEDMTITASTTEKAWTFTCNAEGTSADGVIVTVYYNTRCGALPMNVEKDGFKFVGWEYDGVTYNDQSTWTEILDDNDAPFYFTAKWVAKEQLTVTFVHADGSTEVKALYLGDTLYDQPTPKDKVGYTVDKDYWYKEPECIITATFYDITEDVIFYAKATPNTYTVTLDANGGTVASTSMTVTYDAPYTLPTPTHSDAYTQFVCWKDENGATISDGTWKKDGGASLKAEWKDVRKDFVVSFVQAGQETKTFNVKQGDNFTAIPDVVAKTGYNVEWKAEDLAKLANVQESVVVTVEVTAKTYMVTFNANGGSVENASMEVTYDKTYTLPTPTHSNTFMSFVAWKDENGETVVNGTWTKDGNATLTAEWVNTQGSFTVTFVQAGQADKTFENVLEGTNFTEIPTPAAKKGYTVEWKAEDLAKLNNISSDVVVNVEETAKTYTITLRANGGTLSSETITVTYGETYALPMPTYDSEHVFQGWKYGTEAIETTGVWTYDEENMVLIASWKETGWTNNY